MPKVRFSFSNKEVVADDGEWLYDVCDRAQSGIPFACKAGACGTCATEVLEGWESLDKQTAREVRTLGSIKVDPGKYRLPCLSDAHGDIVFGKPFNAPEKDTALKIHDVEVESYRPLNATVAEVRFFVKSDNFSFKPGQYVIFHVPHPTQKIRRSYSISTPPSDKRHFEVCVRSVAGGFGSNYVHRLRPGDSLKVEGPYGEFVLEEKSPKKILMIATGTGMSPIKSMLLHLLDTRSSRKVKLFFGVRHESDLFYLDLFRGLKAHYPEFSYETTLSSPNPERWSGHRGRVTDLVQKYVEYPETGDIEAYLCGGQEMIEDCKEQLLKIGFPAGSIHHENFY
jgi:ferredoxin-NADP reductase/ferredoxin